MTARFTLVLLAGMLIVPEIQSQPSGKPRTDDLGDVLPEGAIARLGTLRFKHSPANDPTIDVACFSPDGTKIVSLVYNMGTIRLWDAASGTEVRGPWSTATQRHTAVAFSPDGKLLAAASNPNPFPQGGNEKAGPGETAIYDLAQAKAVTTIAGQKFRVRALAFADEGKTLVTAGEGTVAWWDIATGKEKRSWQPFPSDKVTDKEGTKTKTFYNCALAPDAKSIAVHVVWRLENPGQNQRPDNAPTDQEALGYDLASGAMRWRSIVKARPNNPNQMSRFAFSANGKCVAVAMSTNKVEVRDTLTGKLVASPFTGRLPSEGILGGLALSSDGSMGAFAGTDSHVALWNTGDASPPRNLVARIAQFWGNSTQCLHFAPDNKTLLIGADADLQLYDVATLREIRPSAGHRGWLDYVAFAADGKRLLTGSADVNFHCQELAAWDAASWKRLQMTSLRAPPWPNLGVASPEQSVYVGKNGADRFSLFDLPTGKLLARFSMPGKTTSQERGFFSPSGKFYVLQGQDALGKPLERLYAIPSGKLLAQLPPLSVTQQSMESCRPIAFSCDERRVALFAQDDGMIHVLDSASGKRLLRLGNGLDRKGQAGKSQFLPANLAFSQDGKFLASWWMVDNLIRVWDATTGKEILQIVPVETRGPAGGRGNQPRVHFAWSPDSRTLAVGQNQIRLWELASLGVRREFAGHADGPVRALAYGLSGRVLASGSADTTVLIWDTALPKSIASAPERGALEKRWQTLADADAAKAYVAIRDLVAVPEASVAWIKEKMHPAEPLDAKWVDDLIGRLNDSQFKERQKAMTELLRIGDRAVAAIDKAMVGKPALETHLRLQDLRKRMTGLVLHGERLQMFRAVEVLEEIGTPQARQVLAALADGAAGALLTTQAREALERLQGK